MELKDLKVGETYVDNYGTLKEVLCIGKIKLLYKTCNIKTMEEHDWCIDDFLKQHSLPKKPKTKWYKVSYLANNSNRPFTWDYLYRSKEDFLKDHDMKECDCKFVHIELVYEG